MDTATLGYVRGGGLTARAACDAPLAANILSTLSYQLANTSDPRAAAVLARTAYAGGHRQTPRGPRLSRSNASRGPTRHPRSYRPS
jgi:hypothetical protein